MKKFFWFFLIFSLNWVQGQHFETYRQFRDSLSALVSISEATRRDSLIAEFWQDLKSASRIPFAIGDSVAFLYNGPASSIRWVGDFNQWGRIATGYGTRLVPTNLWIWETIFPSEARLDYKIIRNGSEWILDPANPYKQMGGFGYNSELRMPDYVYPTETIARAGTPKGMLSGWQIISSHSLGYDVNFRVYIPYGYEHMADLPCIYVTDGQEYSDDLMGSMKIVLDNLIYDQKIRPIIAVFVSPVNPYNNRDNRRMMEYNMNPSFLDFFLKELIPWVQSHYRVSGKPGERAILGTSMGGLNSMYFGLQGYSLFGCIAIQSPAFEQNRSIYTMADTSTVLPIRIAMTTGSIYDTENAARTMKGILESKGYALYYKEVPEGHSWGNWRALLDDILTFFFPMETSSVGFQREEKAITPVFRLKALYPNPFNGFIRISFELSRLSEVEFRIFDTSGRVIFSQNAGILSSGSHLVHLGKASWGTLPTGIYFLSIWVDHKNLTSKKLLFVK